MRKLQLSLMLAAVVLLTSCGKGSEAGISFSNYVKDADVENPDGLVASLELTLPMPQGEGEPQTRVTNAIKELVSRSRIAEELGSPEGESVKAIADNYYERFNKGVSEGNLEPQCVYHLQITSPYSNSQCAVLHISDGVYANGGPREYVWNVRLSDGQLMSFQELFTMNRNDLIQLAEQYATGEDYEDISLNLEDSWLYPTLEGFKVKAQTGTHLFRDFAVPKESVVPYLTDEGKKLFEVVKEAEDSRAATQTTTFTDTEYPVQYILKAYEAIWEKQSSLKQMETELAPFVEEAKAGEIPVSGNPFGISCSKAVVYDYNIQQNGINILLQFIPDEGTDFHLADHWGPYGKTVYCLIYGNNGNILRQTVTWATDNVLGITFFVDINNVKKWETLYSIKLVEQEQKL